MNRKQKNQPSKVMSMKSKSVAVVDNTQIKYKPEHDDHNFESYKGNMHYLTLL